LPDLTPDADLRESLQSWVQQRVGDIQPLLDEAQRLWNQYQATQITDAPSHLLIYVKDESTRMSDSLSSTDRLSLIKLVNALMQPDFESLVFAIKAPTYLIPSNFSAQGNRSAALLQWVESPGGCGLSEFLAVLKEVAPGAFKVTAVPSPTQPASPTPKAQSKKTPMSSPSSRPIRIFLAHAQEDKQKVFELYDRLKKQGYQPWLDKKDLLPGQRWREEIPKAIKNSDIFLACLSEIAVAKQGYVQREFRMALNACADRPSGTIYLIPLRFDDCRIPELRQEEYGISLWDYHWLDYFEADGFARLIQSIEVHFPGSPPAQRVEEMAPQASSFQADLGSDISLDMVHIPGGEFMMGSPQTETGRHDREGPQHEVTVPNLYMGKYPVTQAQWRAVSLRDRVQRELKPHPSEFNGDNLPVEQVTWFEAVEFCDRLSKHTGYDYRLPSEAEWAYACRARTTSPYSFGDTISTDQVNYDAHYKRTTEVGRFPPNAFGLFDMHGNVWEWCLDHWHNTYEGAPMDGSAWIEGGDSSRRVLRGGAWVSHPRDCRSAYRNDNFPDLREYYNGFRVVCSAPRTL
jgi:formylglycine-generating enzyme required for sulfatase activity